VDDDGVDRRQVEAGFDDVGGQQDVGFAVVEGGDARFELARRHLAVGEDDVDLGHQLGQGLADPFQVFDARAHVEGLAAAVSLAQDGLAYDHRIVGQHEGAHRQAVDRRRGDQA